MFHRKRESGLAAVLITRESPPSFDQSRRVVEGPPQTFAVADIQTFPSSTTKTKSRRSATLNSDDHRNENLPGTLTRKAIVKAIAGRCEGVSQREAYSLLDDVMKEMVATLALGEKVNLSEFGSFIVRKKNTRPGRNFRTGAIWPVSARQVVIFRAASKLKAAVNGGASGKALEKPNNTAARLIDLERRARFWRYDSGLTQHANAMRKLAD